MTTKPHPTDAMEMPEPVYKVTPGHVKHDLAFFSADQIRAERIKAYDSGYQKAKEDVAAFVSTQRNTIPATGEEFAAAIRSMKHDYQQ